VWRVARPPELIRLAGSLETISKDIKVDLVGHFLESARNLAEKKQHCALVSLGLLLNRIPLYAGMENVLSPDSVGHAYEALCDLDWAEPELAEIQTLFSPRRACDRQSGPGPAKIASRQDRLEA
jgi:hypothetical protein